jgi:hypothetical protein
MRNVLFGIVLVALAVMQIAVVSSELSPSRAEIAAVERTNVDMRQALASNESNRPAAAF